METGSNTQQSTQLPIAQRLCSHQFIDGRTCRQPALSESDLCRWHVPKGEWKLMRERLSDLQSPEDVRRCLVRVMEDCYAGTIDPRRAASLLYGLQIAATTVRELERRNGGYVPSNWRDD